MVRPEDAVPATALLETATGALAAIEAVAGRSSAARSTCRRTPSVRITVHVPHSYAPKAAARLQTMLDSARTREALGTVRLEEADVRDEAWALLWKKFYRPFLAAPRLYVAPSWQRTFHPPRGSRVLWIDPAMAFGTGQHPTTQLALGLLLRRVRSGTRVLDIGCGSGILGLAAAQRGARVYASDMDSVAVQTARANFAANELDAVAIRSWRGVPASFPRAHIIAANITTRVLTNLAGSLARKLLRGGLLITSGVTENDRTAALAAFHRVRLELLEECSAGPWYAHVHRKRSHR